MLLRALCMRRTRARECGRKECVLSKYNVYGILLGIARWCGAASASLKLKHLPLQNSVGFVAVSTPQKDRPDRDLTKRMRPTMTHSVKSGRNDSASTYTKYVYNPCQSLYDWIEARWSSPPVPAPVSFHCITARPQPHPRSPTALPHYRTSAEGTELRLSGRLLTLTPGGNLKMLSATSSCTCLHMCI